LGQDSQKTCSVHGPLKRGKKRKGGEKEKKLSRQIDGHFLGGRKGSGGGKVEERMKEKMGKKSKVAP